MLSTTHLTLFQSCPSQSLYITVSVSKYLASYGNPVSASSMASAYSSMAAISLLLLSLALLFETHLAIPPTEDVHDLLPHFGFPRGLIPSSVKEYSLSEDGEFEVHMDHPCYVQFDDLVYYDKKIKGHLSYGSVSDVTGIQAKKFFLWVPVTGIDAASGYIQFHVGALSETLPAEQFENVRVCKAKALIDSIWEVTELIHLLINCLCEGLAAFGMWMILGFSQFFIFSVWFFVRLFVGITIVLENFRSLSSCCEIPVQKQILVSGSTVPKNLSIIHSLFQKQAF